MVEKLKKFFWLCSGVDIQTLEKCPSESTKYAGIGATIFFTGIFAALAGAYALYTVFDNIYAAIGFGLVWGLMIFNLDRYIVSSMRKRKKVASEFLMASPRIVLAVLISIVIAKPIELKIFEKEIDSEIAMMQQEDLERKTDKIKNLYQADQEQLRSEIDNLKQEIERKTNERNQLQMLAQQEADGTGGTMQRNAGPIYKIKKADADRANDELQKLKANDNQLIINKQTQLDSIQSLMSDDIRAIEKSELNGMASRLEAFSRLSERSEAIYWAGIFIMILFMAVESAPVLVKLMSPVGPYDYILLAEHHKYKTAQYADVATINANLKKRKRKLTNEERTYLEQRLNISLQDT